MEDIVLIAFFILYSLVTLRLGPRFVRFGFYAIWNRETPSGYGLFSGHVEGMATLLGAIALFNGVLWIGLGGWTIIKIALQFIA